ncbi:MAG: hypothetical protein H6713_26900 [Myxococcales bacterium]|nr:hypothetical protein [Myxococcales bacterium]
MEVEEAVVVDGCVVDDVSVVVDGSLASVAFVSLSDELSPSERPPESEKQPARSASASPSDIVVEKTRRRAPDTPADACIPVTDHA